MPQRSISLAIFLISVVKRCVVLVTTIESVVQQRFLTFYFQKPEFGLRSNGKFCISKRIGSKNAECKK